MESTGSAVSGLVDEAAVARAGEMLNRLLSHKVDSLFKYVLESSPYVGDGDEELLRLVARVACSHNEQARELTRAIVDELDAVPDPLGHDIGIADLNYLSLRYLLEMLCDYQEHCLEETREYLPDLAAFPASAKIVERLIEQDKRDLDELRSSRSS